MHVAQRFKQTCSSYNGNGRNREDDKYNRIEQIKDNDNIVLQILSIANDCAYEREIKFYLYNLASEKDNKDKVVRK